MRTATNIGVGFCMFIYLFSSIIAMILFSKEKVIDTVLDNFEQTLKNKDTITIIYVTMIIVLICFLVSATMSLPLIFFSFKYTVLNFILFFKKNFLKKTKNISEYEKLVVGFDNDNHQKDKKAEESEKESIAKDKINEEERENENSDKITLNENIQDENMTKKEILSNSLKLVKISNFEEKIWTLSSYVFILLVTLLIEKLEIVIKITIFLINKIVY